MEILSQPTLFGKKQWNNHKGEPPISFTCHTDFFSLKKIELNFSISQNWKLKHTDDSYFFVVAVGEGGKGGFRGGKQQRTKEGTRRQLGPGATKLTHGAWGWQTRATSAAAAPPTHASRKPQRVRPDASFHAVATSRFSENGASFLLFISFHFILFFYCIPLFISFHRFIHFLCVGDCTC